MSEHLLWYPAPATVWTEALPIGNGALGAMCFGDATEAVLALNDETAWSGSPDSESLPPVVTAAEASDALALARTAIAEGRYVDADAAVTRLQHRHTQSFLPFATVRIRLESADGSRAAVHEYRRELDLETATHTVSAEVGGIAIVHRTWVSAPHGVLVHEIDASAAVNVAVSVDTPLRELRRETDTSSLSMLVRMPTDIAPPHDETPNPIRYTPGEASLEGALHLAVVSDGAPETSAIGARGARRIRIVLATDTTFTGIGQSPAGTAHTAAGSARARVAAAIEAGIDAVRVAQIADHAALYRRSELELPSPATERDTATRLGAVNQSSPVSLRDDPGLAALLFHYGRYLLICSSRPGGLPANLQGLWNDQLRPVWSSNYTTNINVQMNYWAAHTTALSETELPLIDLIGALAMRGEETAARLYGAPGWVAHHNTDAWAYTQPVGGGAHDPKWAFWPMAGLWLCMHLADRDRFGVTDAAARARSFQVVRSAAQFALAWLVELPDGSLGTSPSTSPENDFVTPDGGSGSVATSSTLDLTLIRPHLEYLVGLAGELGVGDDDVVEAARAALPLLPSVRGNRRRNDC